MTDDPDPTITTSDVSPSSSGYDPAVKGRNSTRLTIHLIYTNLRDLDDPEATQAAHQLRVIEDVHEQYETALVLARRFDVDSGRLR